MSIHSLVTRISESKKLCEWWAGGYRGYLTVSRTSCLNLGTDKEPRHIGVHLVASYDEAKTNELDDKQISLMLSHAVRMAREWRANNFPEARMSSRFQEFGWGTQEHFHVHFEFADMETLRATGHKPQRFVDPPSRIKKLEEGMP